MTVRAASIAKVLLIIDSGTTVTGATCPICVSSSIFMSRSEGWRLNHRRSVFVSGFPVTCRPGNQNVSPDTVDIKGFFHFVIRNCYGLCACWNIMIKFYIGQHLNNDFTSSSDCTLVCNGYWHELSLWALCNYGIARCIFCILFSTVRIYNFRLDRRNCGSLLPKDIVCRSQSRVALNAPRMLLPR